VLTDVKKEIKPWVFGPFLPRKKDINKTMVLQIKLTENEKSKSKYRKHYTKISRRKRRFIAYCAASQVLANRFTDTGNVPITSTIHHL